MLFVTRVFRRYTKYYTSQLTDTNTDRVVNDRFVPFLPFFLVFPNLHFIWPLLLLELFIGKSTWVILAEWLSILSLLLLDLFVLIRMSLWILVLHCYLSYWASCFCLRVWICWSWFETSSYSRGTQRQFSENICSEDHLRSRIFGTFVVKFLACLLLLGFSNI